MNMRTFDDVPVVTGEEIRGRLAEAAANGHALQQVKTQWATAVAVQKPRSISRMVAQVLAEAEQAGSSFYYRWEVENRRSGSRSEVIGGSIDLAAAIFRAYGNCAMEIQCNETPTHYFFTATMIDLESGMSWPRMFRQRKAQEIGRFDADRQEDIVFQIGQSKAMRNAILSVMPRWVVEKAIETARNAEIRRLAGKENIELARAEVLRYFGKLGVSRERIEAKIGKSIDEAGPDELADLRATATAIKDRMTTAAEAFPEPEKEAQKDEPPAEAKPEPKTAATADTKQEHQRRRGRRPREKREGAAAAFLRSPDIKSIHPVGGLVGQSTMGSAPPAQDPPADATAPEEIPEPEPDPAEFGEPPEGGIWDDDEKLDPSAGQRSLFDQGEAARSEKSELAALKASLKELGRAEPRLYMQAQRNLGFAVGLSYTPPSIDGCVALQEEIARLKKAHKP
ncbi:MAG: hypothetical protein WHT06_14670 [Desulfobacterales bacterium]